MLKEFVDALAARVLAAQAPQLQTFDKRRDVVYVENGKVTVRDRTRGPQKNHQVTTIQSLVDLIKWAYDIGRTDKSVAFVRLNQVDFFYDSEDREDAVTFELPASEQYRALHKINRTKIQQRDLIRLLRIELADTVDQQDSLIAKLRQVKWSSEDNVTSIVDKGKANLSKDMMKQFIAVDTLPDTLYFNVPIYESKFDCVEKLKFDLTPDEDSRQFVLTAYPGEFARAESRAIAAVMAFLDESLGDTDIQIVAGEEAPS